MEIRLAYGKRGLLLRLQDTWNIQVIEPHYEAGLADPHAALTAALRDPILSKPLAGVVQPGQQVGIIVNDITRATPNALLLEALLAELEAVPKEDITLFIALGTHRSSPPEELVTLLGKWANAGYRIVQNNAFDPETQVCLGTTQHGNEIWLNRALAACQVKILTGFIEPHLFAGVSGGGKAIMPGMAGLQTILRNHCARNLADLNATWGVTWGNPVWEEVREIAHSCGEIFLLNITLNRDKEITAIFAGDLDEAHARGTQFVRQTAMVPVDEPFDIVVTTNSGYPLDLNLYQSIKGVSAAAQIVREGGAIIAAAECWDGIPEHGLYGRLLKEAGSPQAVLDTIFQPGYLEHDQWEAQMQAQIQLKADVYIHSDYLTNSQLSDALLKAAPSIEETLETLVARYGSQARIGILPEGPQTIPYLAGPSVKKQIPDT